MKLHYKALLFCILFVGVERFCHWQTEGFTIQKILPVQPTPSCDTTVSLQENELKEIGSILSQPFSYLACGNSCYAFHSADGRYILKVFKQHHLYPMPWANRLPLPSHWRALLEKRQHKRERVFTSCSNALRELKDITGLIYLHLCPAKQLQCSITLIDKLGITHHIAADDLDFLLQKKAVPAYPYIHELLAQHNVKGAQNAIEQIVQLHSIIAARGFNDLDPNIETNFGFIDGQAMKIDVGCLIKDARFLDKRFASKRMAKPLNRLLKCLKAHGSQDYLALENSS